MQTEIKFRWLLLGSFLVNVGNSFIWPLTTVYIHDQLHQSLTVSGIVLLFYSGTNVIGSYVGGRLFDKYSPQRLTLGGIVAAVIFMGVLVFKNDWPTYPIMLALIGIVNGWLMTMHNSYGARMRSRDGRFVFNMLYFANNLGMVFGTTIVGPLYQYAHDNVGPLFLVTVVMYAAFSLVVIKFYQIAVIKRPQHEEKMVKLPRANSQLIWTMSGALLVIWMMYSQWSSNMSVYITGHGVSMTSYSLLWTINGLLIVALQMAINWLNRRMNNDHLYLYFGAAMLGLSFLILPFAKGYGAFVFSMVVLTLGEATAIPTIPALVNQLCPMEDKGRYQGIVNSFGSAGKALGPLFGGLVIERFSYQPLFYVCTLAILGAGLVSWLMIEKNHHQAEYY